MNIALIDTAQTFVLQFRAMRPAGWPALLRRAQQVPAAPTTQRLGTGATTWLQRPLGRSISCESGTLWLTFDGEPQDIILEAGESHRCASSAKLAIHALAPAALRVS